MPKHTKTSPSMEDRAADVKMTDSATEVGAISRPFTLSIILFRYQTRTPIVMKPQIRLGETSRRKVLI